ncbi:hypothetical protein [uncultured Pontibacter sp.]|uniref:hypothetical protein n=1 Tax=uncultured Pontibacter sp. TaxID=453356 RepID=UPI002610B176|nr:hypothetical protein [uncultured Pontibacter sp.]
MKVLFCRWQHDADLIQVAEGYQAVLELAKTYQTNFWLQDLRKRSYSDKAFAFEKDLVLALDKTLSIHTYIAYLMLPLQKELITKGTPLVRTNNNLTIRYFINEHDALLWLERKQQNI